MTKANLEKLSGILDSLTDLEVDIARNSAFVGSATQITQEDWFERIHRANSAINDIYRAEEKN